MLGFGFWMGGAEKHVSGDLLLFIHEAQLKEMEQYAVFWRLYKTAHERLQTSKHKHTNVLAAADQAAVENICRGQPPTCRSHFTLYLDFPEESMLAERLIPSAILQMLSIILTKTCIWLQFLSVLASSSSGACPSSVRVSITGRSSCPGSTPGHNTGSPYWAALNEPTLKPVTY